MGNSQYLLEGLNLPYVVFGSNVGGQPDGATARDAGNTQTYGATPTTPLRSDVPWATLDGALNTSGFNLAPGYAFDVAASGFVGFTFNVQTYPGLAEWLAYDFEGLRSKLYAIRPDWKAQRPARRRRRRPEQDPAGPGRAASVATSRGAHHASSSAVDAVPLRHARRRDAAHPRRVRRRADGARQDAAHRDPGRRRGAEPLRRARRRRGAVGRRAGSPRSRCAGLLRPDGRGAADPHRPEGA